jgi:cysteine protease ATG4
MKQRFLTNEECSGRPSASHYFIGVQGSSFFFLDPHHTRPALSYRHREQTLSIEEIDSCHTRKLRRLHVEKMDPSMLIGFLIRTEEDWQDWKRRVMSTQGAPIIHVSDIDIETSSPSERASALDEVEALDDDE